jgi:hypothetical protein
MVRDLVFAAAARRHLSVAVIGNSYCQIPQNSLFTMTCVPGGFDVADDHIAEHVVAGDLVITSDIPLAAKIVAKGALGLNSGGTVFDKNSTGELLSMRNLMHELRGGGMISGGPPPPGNAEKKRFADALDRLLAKAKP